MLQPMADKPVLSRAWASLPSSLQIFKITNGAEIGNTPDVGEETDSDGQDLEKTGTLL
jgi:hypothetical protein